MPKLSMSIIKFRVGVKTLTKIPKVPFHIAGVLPQYVYANEEMPAHYLVTVDNFRLCFLGLKTMTSRSRDERKSDPPLKPGKTYPLVPFRSSPGYARVIIEKAEPVYLSETTQEVVNLEGYGWLGLTVEDFLRGFSEFKSLKEGSDPPLWRYTYSLLKFERPSDSMLALIRARSMPRSNQSKLL